MPNHRLRHHKSQWDWRLDIEGDFPSDLVEFAIRPYLEAFRPRLVANRRVQVGAAPGGLGP